MGFTLIEKRQLRIMLDMAMINAQTRPYIAFGAIGWLFILLLMIRIMQVTDREMREADTKALCGEERKSK